MAKIHVTNRNRWTESEENLLSKIIQESDTKSEAFVRAAGILGRSAIAVQSHHYQMMAKRNGLKPKFVSKGYTKTINYSSNPTISIKIIRGSETVELVV